MWHVGIDLHRRSLTIAAVHDSGEVTVPQRLECSGAAGIVRAFEPLRPFRAVVEATGTYRRLYKLLSPLGARSCSRTRYACAACWCGGALVEAAMKLVRSDRRALANFHERIRRRSGAKRSEERRVGKERRRPVRACR